MTEEWLLTVEDVAEVLGTTRDTVVAIIAREELPVEPGRKVLVSHAAVKEYVAAMQRDALMLGREPEFVPSILGSRPCSVIDEDDTQGGTRHNPLSAK